MDEQQWIQHIEAKAQQKARTLAVLEKHGVVRQDWTCDCGAKFKWYSEYQEQRHRASAKHRAAKQKVALTL